MPVHQQPWSPACLVRCLQLGQAAHTTCKDAMPAWRRKRDTLGHPSLKHGHALQLYTASHLHHSSVRGCTTCIQNSVLISQQNTIWTMYRQQPGKVRDKASTKMPGFPRRLWTPLLCWAGSLQGSSAQLWNRKWHIFCNSKLSHGLWIAS